MKVMLVDSPVANIANIGRALRAVGADLTISSAPAQVRRAQTVVLPGVGTFSAAMHWLRSSGIGDAIREAVESGASLLGICVGHQVLFESSSEMGHTRGLGLLRGSVEILSGALPVPQIGWNSVSISDDPLFAGIAAGTSFYFVHSYHAVGADEQVIARSDYGGSFNAAARLGRVCGVQFHPERSSRAGLRVLSNFVAQGGAR